MSSLFGDLASILKESQRLKAENRKLRAFVRATAKGHICDGPAIGECHGCLALDLLAKLDRAKPEAKP